MRALLLFLSVVVLLSGCGYPVCVAGIGNCEVHKKAQVISTGARWTYTLTATPATVVYDAPSTLKLTTNNPRAPSPSCEWKMLDTGVGGSFAPDPQPMVFGALCTAQFTAPRMAGTATIRVNEKASGNTSQVTITVTAP